VTRFLEIPSPQSLLFSPNDKSETLWIYDKTEDQTELLSPAFWERFDYVLAEQPEKVIGKWEVVDTIEAFAGIKILRPGMEDLIENAMDACVGKEVGAGEGMAKRLGTVTVHGYREFENLMRRYVTKGCWVGIKVEPRIRILKKVVSGK
jgi:alpha-1,6-mannosyltransferase